MNDIDAGILASTVLVFLAKHSMDQAEALAVAALILNDKGIENLKNTRSFKALVEKADTE
jgi:hypothetical protein